jgi:hypothetical protein
VLVLSNYLIERENHPTDEKEKEKEKEKEEKG